MHITELQRLQSLLAKRITNTYTCISTLVNLMTLIELGQEDNNRQEDFECRRLLRVEKAIQYKQPQKGWIFRAVIVQHEHDIM